MFRPLFMSDTLLSTLAERVHAERLRLGWTQSEVAARLGVSAKTYARFERSAAVTVAQLGKALELLGLTLLVVPANSVAAPMPDPKALRSRRRAGAVAGDGDQENGARVDRIRRRARARAHVGGRRLGTGTRERRLGECARSSRR